MHLFGLLLYDDLGVTPLRFSCYLRAIIILLGMKFISRYYFRLSFYLTGVLVCIYFGLAAFGGKPDLQYTCTASSGHILTFLCASYRSLYLLSSLCLVRLCDVLFLVTANIIPTCYSISKSYLLQCYKTHIFQNAYIFSSKLATRISQGLNVTHLSVLVLCKLNSGSLAQDMYLLEGIGLIFNGRIKGHFKIGLLVKCWVEKQNIRYCTLKPLKGGLRSLKRGDI